MSFRVTCLKRSTCSDAGGEVRRSLGWQLRWLHTELPGALICAH